MNRTSFGQFARRRRAAGFTLIEAALTTVIVGVGVLAIMSAQQAYHRKNQWAQRTGTAVLLANEIREMTLSLPQHDPFEPTHMGPEDDEPTVADYDDLDDFAGTVTGGFGTGTTFSPPINALLEPIPDMDDWQQTVVVENVLENYVSGSPVGLGTTDMMRVTVTIQARFNGDPIDEPPSNTITELTWLVGAE